MIKVVNRSGYIGSWLKATTAVAATNLLPIVPAVPEEQPPKFPLIPQKATAYTSSCNVPSKRMTVVTGPTVSHQVRFNHTDVTTPDFSDYRKDNRKNPFQKSADTEGGNKYYTHVTTAVLGAIAVYSAKSTVLTFVGSMSATADVLAMAKIEIDKSDIPEGKSVTFKWRGKPLFVRHRTPEEISTEGAVDVSTLRDPQHDKDRVKEPEWLIVIGICTHLGCVPIANQGEWGGYYCPCHGSHYDASGRIRKGPAPLNLEIPPYEISESKIVVG